MIATSDFQTLASNYTTTRFDHSLEGIQGWLSPAEKRALYGLARGLSGPIFEIGPWVGLSTACMAYGIRDSGQSKALVTAEINATQEFYRPVGDQIGFFFPGETTPRGLADLAQHYKYVDPVLREPERGIGQLRQNLTRLGLLDLVTIIEGDFTIAPNLGYRLIFCDTLHSPLEISLVLPGLRSYLAAGTVLACHDTNPENEVCLRAGLPVQDAFRVDSLLVLLIGAGNLPRKKVVPWRKPTPSATPAISVVLPTRNRASRLPRAIWSVLKQHFSDFELIVVDDGSTDETQTLLAGFEEYHLRVLRLETSCGAAAARNAGVAIARAGWIAFQDSDDEWLPDKLTRQWQEVQAGPSDLAAVFSGYWRVGAGRATRFPGIIRRISARLKPNAIHSALWRGNFLSTQTALVRRDCLEKVGGFDERLPRFQDWDLWLRLLPAFPYRLLDVPLVWIYDTPNSISTDPRALRQAFEILLRKYEQANHARNLLGHYHFAVGDQACKAGQGCEGRLHFRQALRCNPTNPTYACAALCAHFSLGIYQALFSGSGYSVSSRFSREE